MLSTSTFEHAEACNPYTPVQNTNYVTFSPTSKPFPMPKTTLLILQISQAPHLVLHLLA